MQKNTEKTKYVPPCPLYKKCGGCQTQNLPYEKQLEFKQNVEQGLLGSFCRVEKIIGMKDPSHYRAKVQAAFKWDYKKRKAVSGIYQSKSHRIVPVDDCYIENKTADRIIVSIRELLNGFKIKPFDEDRGTGVVRHVLVRIGVNTGEIMAVIVTAGNMFPSRSKFVSALLEKEPEITTVVQNINPYKTNLVLGDRSNILFGKGYIEDELCGCRFRISPSSFYQVNPVMTEVLYNTAMEYASLTKNDIALDAYCGTGTIGIIASKYAKQVLGVELNSSAVKDAVVNAKINNVKNTYFICGDAGKFMNESAKRGEKLDVLLMDPPRAGASAEFIKSVLKIKPGKIVYISCNPETLARDLRQLTRNGKYKVKKVQPVDMFPFTHHIETAVLIEKMKDGAKYVKRR